MDKEVRELIRDLKRVPGVTVGRGTHPKVSYKGQVVVTLPTTPGDWRSLKNVQATLKRAGVDLGARTVRPANGQAPPPLPDLKEEILALNHEQAIRKEANRLMKAIEKHFDLTVRVGRQYGHGVAEYAADILLAYSQATGNEIPHMNSIEYPERNEPPRTATLSAQRIKKAGADHLFGRDSVVTRLVERDVALLTFAWDWFLKNEGEVQVGPRSRRGRITVTPTPAEPIEVNTEEDGFHVETAASNGDVLSDDLALRVLAKLVRGGTDEVEAIKIAKEIASR